MKRPNDNPICMVYEPYRAAKRRKLLSREEQLRKEALALGLSKQARNRLEWILHRERNGASLTCRHFGIGRSLLHKRVSRFDEENMRTLEDLSRAPKRNRKREASPVQDGRVIALRKRYPAYGKEKIKVLYEREYGEPITSWYVQRVIETFHLQRRKSGRKPTNVQGKPGNESQIS